MSDCLANKKKDRFGDLFFGGGGGGSNPASNFSPAAGMEAMNFANYLGSTTDWLLSLLSQQAAPLLFGVPNQDVLQGPFGFVSGTGLPGENAPGQGGGPWQTGNFAAYGAPGLIMQQAFDPQKELYNRTKQGILSDTASQLAGTGLANTPAGAAVLADASKNFNIDWQNNLLNRETTGASAAENLYGGFVNAGTGATQPLQAATSDLLQLEKIASDAKTTDLNRSAQESQFGTSSALGGLQSIGGLLGSGPKG
jgi:hypothetical protein